MCNAFDVGFGDKTIEVIIITIFLDIFIAKDRQMSNIIFTHIYAINTAHACCSHTNYLQACYIDVFARLKH